MQKTKKRWLAFILAFQIIINLMPVLGSEINDSGIDTIDIIESEDLINDNKEELEIEIPDLEEKESDDEVLESEVEEKESDDEVLESEVEEKESDDEVLESEVEEKESDGEVLEPEVGVNKPDREVLEPEVEVNKPDGEVLEPEVEEKEISYDISTDVIDKVTITTDLTDYKPKIGDVVELKFDFTLPGRHNYGDGSKLTYTLPNPLKPVEGTGSLTNEDGVEYAIYNIVNGDIILTFNDNIRFYGEDGSEGLKTIGYFEMEVRFELDEDNSNLEQEIILPGSDIIILEFSPQNGTMIEKDYEAENDSNSSSYVKWLVSVNTIMDNLGNEGYEFKDTLVGNHKYDMNSLKVTRYKLDLKGDRTEELDVTHKYINSMHEDSDSFSLLLTGKYAYDIEYKTIPGDTDEREQIISNKAEFKSENTWSEAVIKYGDPLLKSVRKSGERADWLIRVNGNRKKLKAGTIIYDSWDSDKHSMLINTFKINNNVNIEEEGFSVRHYEKGFDVILNKDITEEFEITYSTHPKDYITKESNIKNTVYRSDRPDDKKSATAKYKQNVLGKSNSNINYDKKTVDWKIVVNSAGYKMDFITIEDEFVYKNLKIIDGTFKVIVDGKTIDNYEISHKDGDNAGDEKGGFTLKIFGPIDKPITITYTTEYDVRGVTNLDKYKNKVSLEWTSKGMGHGSGPSYTVNDYENSVIINNQQKNKGYKIGSYNYENKKITWGIGINYNFDHIVNPELKDKISNSQIIDIDSIIIYRLDLTPGGTGWKKGDPLIKDLDYLASINDDGNELLIRFTNDIDEAYYIEYTSQNKDDYYPPKNGKYKVKNHATLNGGDHGSWTHTVEVEHTENLINKNHLQEGNSAKLHWNLKLNWSQSSLDNVVIKDIVGKDKKGNPNQMIYKDSFKIYEMNYSNISSTPKKGEMHLPGEKGKGLYYIEFEEDVFNIIFNEPINKAYMIEYDTYFLGASGETLENKVELSYISKTQGNGNDSDSVLKKEFKFSGHVSTEKGQIEIIKVDKNDNNKRLSGAVFELWSSPTGFLIERVEKDTDGIYKFLTKVGRCEYYLKEVIAPEGYSLEESEYKNFKEVVIDDSLKRLVIENTKLIQAVKLVKVDKDDENKRLSGAKFLLYNSDKDELVEIKDANGNIVTQPFTTNEQGEIVVGNLAPGNYYFKEVESPKYYPIEILGSSKHNFTISDNQIEVKNIIVKNTRGRGKITIKKIDWETKEPLQDVVFSLKKENKEPFKDGEEELIAKTNEYGIVEFKELQYDRYILTEVKTQESYVLNKTPKEIILDSNTNNEEISIIVENIKKDYSMQLTKYNEDKSQELKGAKFKILKEYNGEYKEVKDIEANKLITDDSGIIAIKHLDVGKYKLIEIEAPVGYELDKKPLEFEIIQDQTSPVILEKINIEEPTESGDSDKPSNPKENTPNTPKPENPNNKPNIEPEIPTDSNYENPPKKDEDIFIEIEDNEIPLGGTEIEIDEEEEKEGNKLNLTPTYSENKINKEELPKTGQSSRMIFYIVGLFAIILGISMRKKKA